MSFSEALQGLLFTSAILQRSLAIPVNSETKSDRRPLSQLIGGVMGNGSVIYSRPGKHTKNELERFTMFNGKFHYFYGNVQ